MSAHTPGPWAWRESKVYMGREYIGLFNEADARLIAAAPDLLEALTMVRDADNDCRKDGLPTIPGPARAKIDAAIAKAEGEKS